METSQSADFSYSVIIRTLGNSGEKYKALLDSIACQTVPPKEVIVAIPDGYELEYQNGNETILRTMKGMVIQRAEGIQAANTEYILVVDDDIDFEPSFVESLYQYGTENSLDCVLPMEGMPGSKDIDRIDLRYPLVKRIRCAITGQMFQSNMKSRYLDIITATAGHKVFLRNNYLDKCYPCQTGNFQCFFIKTDIAKSVHFEDEIWLQQGSISSYSAYDDPSFFYKLFLMGGNIAYSLRTRYRHLDAGAGRKAGSVIDEKRIRYYSIARNRTVFWYRFLFQPHSSIVRKLIVFVGGLYSVIGYTLVTVIANLRPKHIKALAALFQGYASACHIIISGQIPSANFKYRR